MKRYSELYEIGQVLFESGDSRIVIAEFTRAYNGQMNVGLSYENWEEKGLSEEVSISAPLVKAWVGLAAFHFRYNQRKRNASSL